MNNTKPINSNASGKNTDSKKKAVAIASAGVAATGLGVTGAAVLADGDNDEEIILEDVVLEDATEETPEQQTETSNTAAHSNTSTSQTSQATTPEEASESQIQDAVEPQPITEEVAAGEDIPSVDNIEETVTQTVESEPIETSETAGQSVIAGPSEEVVNPEEIAQAIISEEHIDPDDMDMADVVNFDEIGTVYTVDGESYTAATFHDAAGNDLVMIDVDGDNVFDVITDYDGNLIAEVPGNISVGDAMEDIMEEESYLAYDSETDNVDEFDTDSLAEDILA